MIQPVQDVLHAPLVGSWGVLKAKWYPHPFMQTPGCDKCREWSAFFRHEALMVCFALVEGAKPDVPSQTIQDILHSGNGLSVGDGFAIEPPVVDTKAESTILFSDTYHRGRIRRL